MDLSFIIDPGNLNSTYELVDRSVKPLSTDYAVFRKEVEKQMHWTALPALTAAANRHFGGGKDREQHLGAVFCVIYLSDRIHSLVKDVAEGQEHSLDLQFTIISGDYLFGRAMMLLTAINGYRLLGDFADLICMVNEGHTMHKTSNDDLGIMAKETASLYSYGFYTAAVMAEASLAECDLFKEIGLNIGMAMTLAGKGKTAQGLPYLEHARVLLASAENNSSDLSRVIDQLIIEFNPQRKAVAL
ncbi:MAG: hypothetical protein ACM3UZ_01770 [Acidobacteriota bacterium]